MSKTVPIHGGSSRPRSPACAVPGASRCLAASRIALPVHGVSTTSATTPKPPSAPAGRLGGTPIRRARVCDLIPRVENHCIWMRRITCQAHGQFPCITCVSGVLRFNRRHSRSRGMVFYRVLELPTGHELVRYHDILTARKPRKTPNHGEAPAARPAWNVLLRIGPGEPPRCNSSSPLRFYCVPRTPVSLHPGGAGAPLRRYPGPDLAGGQRQGDVLLVLLGQERIDTGHGRAGRRQRGYLVIPAAGQASDR
jgi:hypothetical protein